MTTNQPSLFSPTRIGALSLANRLVRSATAERLATEPMGRATSALAALYRDLAEGGVGLIITGHAFVDPRGKAHVEMLGAHCDEMIPGLRTLAEAAHSGGGRIALQINHGGRQCAPEATSNTLAPSAVAHPDCGTPSEMSADDVRAAIYSYGQAARRAKLAGFDAVQLHGAHGYLVSQFLSPHTNRRTDRWGNGFEGRFRFLAAVCEEVRGQVGPHYPLFIKLGAMDNLEQVPDGLSLDDGLRVVERLAGLGLDAVEISGGFGGGTDFIQRLAVGTKAPEAYFRSLARKAKAVTDLPVILVGGLRSRAIMEDVLASGDADMIAICRPLIREPDLPSRLQSGEATASACISGGRCWPKEVGQGIRCRCED